MLICRRAPCRRAHLPAVVLICRRAPCRRFPLRRPASVRLASRSRHPPSCALPTCICRRAHLPTCALPSCSSPYRRAHLPAVVLICRRAPCRRAHLPRPICRRAHLPLLICQLAPSRQLRSRQSHRAVCAQPSSLKSSTASVTHSAQLEWLAIRPVIWLAIPIVTAFTYLSHPTAVVLHGRRLAVKCHHCSPHIP